MPWPPQVGELLPRHEEAFGIEEKLRTYSLDSLHEVGGPKATGFRIMIGIGLESIDYLERQVLLGIAETPIAAVKPKESGAVHCTVQFRIAGPGSYSHRKAFLRTHWELTDPATPPRMTNAFLRGKENR